MRVLLIGNFQTSSVGSHSVCIDLAAGFAAAGWTILTTSDRVRRVPRLFDMLATVWRRRDEYDLAQVDVYSGMAFCWAEAVCLGLHCIGKPFVLTLHGGNLPVFARRWSGRVRRLLRSAAAVTAPSRYLVEHMGHYQDDLRLLPNPIHVYGYPFRLRRHPEPRLVWLRSFHDVYNPGLALRTLSLLARDFPRVHLTMVGRDKGDGSFQAAVRASESLDIADRVEFLGGVPKTEVPRWLDRGDVFLNTTNVDNTPVSILEAMASGLCVVSTDAGGVRYLVEDGADALLVPLGDTEAMAAAVHRILKEPDLAGHLSQNARDKAELYDWSAILPQWQNLFERVLSRG